MRILFALAASAAALAGCGDDTGGAADMAMSLDQALGSSADCAAYCGSIQSICMPGDDGGSRHAEYPSGSDCIDYCTHAAAWPGGASGNTLGCRLHEVTVAASASGADVTTHCDAAGPTGNNLCGSWCDNYCQLMLKNCTGANAVYDAATCMSKCATIPASGQPGDVVGNTVQCRIYHMGVAFHDPVTHCPHGKTLADNPSGPCQ